jgi:uncharacterized protein (DUF2147 family)
VFKHLAIVLLPAAAVLFGNSLYAQENSTLGLWKNVEPNRTIVFRLTEQKGELTGKVEKVLKGGVEDSSGKCPKCEGENKDKPVVGMTVVWGMHKESDGRWSGGKILDPDTGKIYACKIATAEGGKKLSVRGSIAFFGKTQMWERVN